MDGLMQFVQVDESGHPEPLSIEPDEARSFYDLSPSPGPRSRTAAARAAIL